MHYFPFDKTPCSSLRLPAGSREAPGRLSEGSQQAPGGYRKGEWECGLLVPEGDVEVF
jgi:hypothetical protein